MFPLVVELDGRRVLVIGAGRVGAQKVSQLTAAGACVDVIAREVIGELPLGLNSLAVRDYQPGDLVDAYLVVSAVGDTKVNDEIVKEANERHIWLNVVDDPERSNFYFTAVHRDGDVIVSVSTTGSSPALAQWVRDRVRDTLPSGLARVADALRAERSAIRAAGQSTEKRPWRARVEALIAQLTAKDQA